MGKNRSRNQKRNVKKGILIGLCVLLALILVLLVASVAYVESRMGLMNHASDNTGATMSPEELEEYLESIKQEQDPDFTGETLEPDDVIWGEDSDLLEDGENVVNILLIGQDRRPGESRSRSDTMILCTLNKVTKTVTMTSFMRDTYVQIPGYKDNRINTSYALGGMELLDQCLEKNFGVVVDGNVEVDFNGFIKVIDMLGGVEMELSGSEAQYLNRRGNWDFDNSTAGTWSLREGSNLLTGEQAMAYARIRDVGNGDFGRTERQRKLLSALVEKAKKMSFVEFDALLTTALPLVTTDMTNAQIIDLALDVFPKLSQLKIVTQRIPAEGAYKMTMISGMSVLLPDIDANKELLRESMKEDFDAE